MEYPSFLQHVPANSTDYFYFLYRKYNFTLKLQNNRISKAGDYRYEQVSKTHRITLNKSLNPYESLITYVHEIAHLLAAERYSRRIKPHGKEWKAAFRELILTLLHPAIFPDQLLKIPTNHLKAPKPPDICLFTTRCFNL